MAVRVSVDPELCIGSAECVRIAPDAFLIDEARGVSEPTDRASTTDPAVLMEAVRTCPMSAIAVERT